MNAMNLNLGDLDLTSEDFLLEEVDGEIFSQSLSSDVSFSCSLLNANEKMSFKLVQDMITTLQAAVLISKIKW